MPPPVLASGPKPCEGNESTDKPSLQDQDKQQKSFFVTRFPVKYSTRIVATVH